MDLNHQRKGRLRQLIRCHQILERLASRRINYNASLLAEELGFTTKTIYRDLRALKEAGVFIEYDAHRKRYLIEKNHLVKAYLRETPEATGAQETGLEELCLSLTEASRYLDLSPRRLKTLVIAGQVPAIQRGRHLRMTIKDLVRVKRLVGNSSQPPDGG